MSIKNFYSIRNALICHPKTLLPLACPITTQTVFGKFRQALVSMVVLVHVKDLAANAAIFLMCVFDHFVDIRHYNVKY